MEVPVKFRPVLVGFSYWLLAFIVLATSTFLVSCSGGGGTNTVTTVTTTTTSTIPTTTTTSIVPIVADSLVITNDTPFRYWAYGDKDFVCFTLLNGSDSETYTSYLGFCCESLNRAASLLGASSLTMPGISNSPAFRYSR